jgi:N-acetylglucosamine malate deacetylase 1
MIKKKKQIHIETKKEVIENCEVLTIGAHNDDYIVGAGGTLAKYVSQGQNFFSVIFSYGENSHPHFKKKVTVSMRVKESLKADKFLGGSGIIYLGVTESKFLEEKNKICAKKAIKKIIQNKKPKKIFTHSTLDPHPDHQAVTIIVKEILDEIKFKGEVYTFDVWNVINFKKRTKPQLIIDVTDTFKKKVEAFKRHKSQQMTIWTLLWHVYLKAYTNGRKYGFKYCEIFDKIK